MNPTSLIFGLAAGLLLPVSMAHAQADRPGRPPRPEIALEQPVRGEQAVADLADALPDIARHYGLAPERLRELLRRDADLWVDREGRLLFAESHLPDPALAPAAPEGAAAPAALVPLNETFLLHSRPSATKKIYLDFDGHTTTGTSWRDYKDGDSTFVTPPYDSDGNAASFGNTELEAIQFIWQRVTEDFSPFDVDVTTEDPGVEALRNSGAGDVNYGIRVCIGGDSRDWYSATCCYGGVAYIGSFDWNSDTPTYVWENNLGNGNEKYVAEAVSHEVGHTLDLYHDGTSTTGYYEGHGTGADGWAPIMGVGYYKPVVQFSRGEYFDANNAEDDLVKITAASNVPYIPDDHGNTTANPTQLAEVSFFAEGLIERNTDVDMFRFNAGAGNFTISIAVDSRSPNLNVEARLLDSSGNVLATSSPAGSLAASFALTGMPAGIYHLWIDGVGSANPLNTGYSGYGSIGTYSVTGTVPLSGYPVAVATATPTSGTVPLAVQFSSTGSNDPDGGDLTYAWNFGDGANSTFADPNHTYTSTGNFTATLSVTDDEGLTSTTSVAITVAGTPPAAPSILAATPASSTRVDLTWQDNAGNESGFRIERSTDNSNFAEIATVAANIVNYADNSVSGGITYWYRVRAYNAWGNSAYSNVDDATTPGSVIPTAPSGLTARAVSSSKINLKWIDTSNVETGFRIERSTDGSTWGNAVTVAANTTAYSVSGLQANTQYWFRVFAFNGAGSSSAAGPAIATTKR